MDDGPSAVGVARVIDGQRTLPKHVLGRADQQAVRRPGQLRQRGSRGQRQAGQAGTETKFIGGDAPRSDGRRGDRPAALDATQPPITPEASGHGRIDGQGDRVIQGDDTDAAALDLARIVTHDRVQIGRRADTECDQRSVRREDLGHAGASAELGHGIDGKGGACPDDGRTPYGAQGGAGSAHRQHAGLDVDPASPAGIGGGGSEVGIPDARLD